MATVITGTARGPGSAATVVGGVTAGTVEVAARVVGNGGNVVATGATVVGTSPVVVGPGSVVEIVVVSPATVATGWPRSSATRFGSSAVGGGGEGGDG